MKASPAPVDGGPPDYDGLARTYRALEYLAFGRSLEAARFCFLERLQRRKRILLLADGDVRCLARALRLHPQLEATCVDASAAMLRRAAGRLSGQETARARLIHADARVYDPPPGTFDAVVTHFFLDGFTDQDVRRIVARVAPSLHPMAPWLIADFALPDRAPARWRARVWLLFLYGFFRWQTGLRVGHLPEIGPAMAEAGFDRLAFRDFQGGMIRSSIFAFRGTGSRPPEGSVNAAGETAPPARASPQTPGFESRAAG